MRKFIPIILILLFANGCIFHSQAGKRTAARLVKRSDYMLNNKKAGIETPEPYYVEQLDDAILNQGDIGKPKEETDIHDHAAVAQDQKQHMKEQEARSILSSFGVSIVGSIMGFLGLGGLFLKIKNSYNKVKAFGEAAAEKAEKITQLHGAMVKGVDKYKDNFESFIDKLPINNELKEKIHDSIGKNKLYHILKTEADKTSYGSDHHKLVEEIKNSL